MVGRPREDVVENPRFILPSTAGLAKVPISACMGPRLQPVHRVAAREQSAKGSGMTRKKAKKRYGKALLKAVSNPRCSPDDVRRLIPLCRMHERNSALCKAVRTGNLAVLLELTPRCDQRAGGSEALRLAAAAGQREMVAALIPISDPAANDSDALRLAAEYGHLDVIRELVPLSDVVHVFENQLNELVGIFREQGLEEVEEQKAYLSSLQAVNALSPHLGDDLQARTVLDLPDGLLKLLPHLAAWRESTLVREAIEPYAVATPCRRRSL